jgi:hypothetical protein
MTSIEWLIDRIAEKSVMEKDRYYIPYNSGTIDITHIIEQAKEMEKQQIIDAYANAVMKENNSDYVGMHEQSSGEIYFDETFVSKESDEKENTFLNKGSYVNGDILLKDCYIVDTNEMVKDDVEKLAIEEYPISKGGSMWMPTSFDLDQSCRQEGYIKGYNKAKETLYTEKQVREALSESFKASQEGYNITSDEIIQSLKQPKKD